jgi:subtilisin family serine protease
MSIRRTATGIAVMIVLALLSGVLTDSVLTQSRPRGQGIIRIDGRDAIEGEVLIRYRDNSGTIGRQRAEFQSDADEVESVGRRGLRRMRSKRLGTRALIELLRANPDIELVEPNYVLRLDAIPTDPSFLNLWGLLNTGQVLGSPGLHGADIDAPLAWDVATGTRANVVGVIDTGIDYTHPDLAANIWSAPAAFSVTIGGVTINCAAGTHGFNAITNTCDPMDDHNHGTHVSGTIGAVGNNAIGITGVNWTASMMGLKFLGSNGTGSTSNAIKAIEFAIQTKAAFQSSGGANVRILSNSWGGGGYSQALAEAINRAAEHDVLFVASAGNSSSNNDVSPSYPASYSSANIVAVAATDNRDQRASFSSYGATSVDLGAPGVNVLSTIRGGQYAYYNGTSMAAPHVAGAAALLLSACTLNTAALKSALIVAVDPIPSMAGVTTTGGRLNVNNAIRVCPPLTNPVPTITLLSPFRAAIGGPTFELTVTGTGFVAGSQARLDGAARHATYVSPTTLTLSILATDIATLGGRSVTIFNGAPGGGTSTASTLTVTPPVGLTVNGTTGSLTVSTGSTVTVQVTNGPANSWDYLTMVPVGSPANHWTGDYRFLNGTTTVPQPGVGDATVSMAAPTLPGTYEVRFLAAGWFTRLATSGVIKVAPPNPAPTVTAVAPASLPAGSAAFSLTVSGTGFTSSSQVRLSGSPRATTYVSPSLLMAAISAGDVATVGSLPVSVVNPPPGGGASASTILSVVVVPPSPVLTSISPSTIAAGGPAYTLTVSGANFTAQSQVTVNGAVRPTVFVSSSMLTATLAAGDRAAAGTQTIRVMTPAPGGGTSGGAPLAIIAASLTVNGTANAISVAPGATMSVVVNNGPANPWDYLTVVPVGSPVNVWTGVYQFLNGTTVVPNPGISHATVSVPAPLNAGVYEIRFNADGHYTRLATSAIITVISPNPVPVISQIAPTAVIAGRPDFMLDLYGSGFTVTSQVRVNGEARATTFVSATHLAAAVHAADVATAGARQVSVFTPAPGGGSSTVHVLSVNAAVPASATALTVDGTTGAVRVGPGATLSVVISDGPGNAWDYLTVVPVGSANDLWTGTFQFLNGTTIAPNPGLTDAVVSVPAPTVPGDYELRLNADGWYTRIATSGVITVLASDPAPTIGSASPTSVTSGDGAFSLTVTGAGFTSASQVWLDGAARPTTFNSANQLTASIAANDIAIPGSRLIGVFNPGPSGGLSGSVSLIVLPAHSGARLLVNGVNGSTSVARGATLSVSVISGPGNTWDYVTIVPEGSANNFWSGNYRFLNGTTVAPNAPMTDAVVELPAPVTAGVYEVRFFANGWYSRLATSGLVTVRP